MPNYFSEKQSTANIEVKNNSPFHKAEQVPTSAEQMWRSIPAPCQPHSASNALGIDLAQILCDTKCMLFVFRCVWHV